MAGPPVFVTDSFATIRPGNAGPSGQLFPTRLRVYVPLLATADRAAHTGEMTIKTLPAMRVAAVAHRGPSMQIGAAFQKLGAVAGPAGLFARANGQMLGIYKDDPATTPAEQLRSAAGIPIGDADLLPAGLEEERLDASRYACVMHAGPYEGLPKARHKDQHVATKARRRQG